MARSCDEATGRWTSRLQRSVSVPGLVQVVEAFIASRAGTEARLLAPGSPAIGPVAPSDVRGILLHLTVTRAKAAAGGAIPRRLGKLFAFFTAAATRLGQLEFESRQREAQETLRSCAIASSTAALGTPIVTKL